MVWWSVMWWKTVSMISTIIITFCISNIARHCAIFVSRHYHILEWRFVMGMHMYGFDDIYQTTKLGTVVSYIVFMPWWDQMCSVAVASNKHIDSLLNHFEFQTDVAIQEMKWKDISEVDQYLHFWGAYRRWGKICWAKYSRFQCHRSFRRNIFALPWP